MMKRIAMLGLLVLLAACGSDDGDEPSAVAGLSLRSAVQTEAWLASGFTALRGSLLRLIDLVPYAVETGMPGPDDVFFGPGEDDNSVVYEFPFDPDGDGTFDGLITGTASALENTTDPDVLYDAVLMFTTTFDDGSSFMAELHLALTIQNVTMYGMASFDDPTSGYAGDAMVEEDTPLVWTLPGLESETYEPGNLCIVDLTGPILFDVDGPGGRYLARWRFLTGVSSIGTFGRSLQLPGEAAPYALPNGTLPLPGCPDNRIEDFEGDWELNTVCAGPDFVEGSIAISVLSSTKLSVSARVPGDSPDALDFTAMLLDANAPHLAYGMTTASDADGDFTLEVVLVLSPSTETLFVVNRTEYTSGPLLGEVVSCGGSAIRD